MKKIPTELNHRMCQQRPGSYSMSLRAWSKPASKRMMARMRIKCGCCDQQVDIFHLENVLEINGVIGTVENWREILLPLLERKPPAAKRPAKKAAARKKRA